MLWTAWFMIILGSVIWLYDFLIGQSKGEAKRNALRRRLGDFWAWAEESDWTGLNAEAANKVLKWFYKIFGPRILSPWSFISAMFISIALTLLLYILVGLYVGMSNMTETRKFRVAMLFPYMISNALFDYVSLIVTILVLRVIIIKTTYILIAGLIIDSLVIYITSCFAYWIGFYWMMNALNAFTDFNILSLLQRYFDVLSNVELTKLPEYLHMLLDHLLHWHVTLKANLDKLMTLRQHQLYKIVALSSEISILIIVTSSIPTLVHASILLLFVSSKILWRPIRGAVALVAGAVYEASDSPIKLLGLGCSALGALLLQATQGQ
jgi:hypothetical protein